MPAAGGRPYAIVGTDAGVVAAAVVLTHPDTIGRPMRAWRAGGQNLTEGSHIDRPVSTLSGHGRSRRWKPQLGAKRPHMGRLAKV
jgi:hypothetical protein